MSKLRVTHPDISVDKLCELFGKTRQAYYQKLKYDYVEKSEETVIIKMVRHYKENMGKLGARKIWYLINSRQPGFVGRDRLFEIMSAHGLLNPRKKRTIRTTWSASWLRRFPNLIQGIVLTASNQVWVSDITYIPTVSGYLYLHLVTDAYCKLILGWNLSKTLHASFTIEALRMAIRHVNCDLTGLIHHSDRGCQYCSEAYVKLLQDNGIEISMTQTGDPRDNPIAERVNGILKTEWFDDDDFQGYDDAHPRVAEVINVYNTQRPHLSLNYQTPLQASLQTGIQIHKWKNYYKSKNQQDEKNRILEMIQ